MTEPPLLKIADAAKLLGVEAAGLRRAAEDHGYLIRVGRAVRVRADELGEIIEQCRDKPRAPGSITAPRQTDGSYSTPAARSGQPALAAAAKLKARSQATSPNGTPAPVVALHRTK